MRRQLIKRYFITGLLIWAAGVALLDFALVGQRVEDAQGAGIVAVAVHVAVEDQFDGRLASEAG